MPDLEQIEKAMHLLQVAKLSAEWPELRTIHNHAMSELQNMSKQLEKALAQAKAEAAKAAAPKPVEAEQSEGTADSPPSAKGKK